MTSKDDQSGVNRREFLAGAGAAGLASASLSKSSTVRAQATDTSNRPSGPVPGEEQEALEFDGPAGYTPDQADRYFVKNPASDFMVDVIKALGIEYIATNPGSTFRGIQESIVNYGGNSMPELLTVTHEELACGMAQGYFKGSGSEKVMGILAHGTVGLAHTPMAVYNAYADRAPMLIIVGNHLDAAERGGGTAWWHSAQDMPKIVRDFTKWDDTCYSLGHFADSMARAYQIATTPPMGPVVIVVDTEQQEEELPAQIPRIHPKPSSVPPHADANAIREIAQWLVEAELPVITVGRMAHNQEGVELLVELAELLQAGVSNSMGRMNFPNTHDLSVGGAVAEADVVLALELNSTGPGRTRPDAKVVTLGTRDLLLKANFQHFGRYYSPDLAVTGDAQASLPALIEEVKRLSGGVRRSTLDARAAKWREMHIAERKASIEAARHGWDSSPVTTARLYGELWQTVKDKDWALVSNDGFQSSWGKRLWPMTRHYHFHGSSGAAGIGYGAPAAVGAALAHREHGRLSVNVQKDGDLMFGPGVLWTAAHHEIPLLNVMHNNRAYHAERMIVQRVANSRNRGVESSSLIGNEIDNPAIDFAKVADGFGLWSAGTITDSKDLRAALTRAVDVVENGEPCLVDVLCKGR